jgi:D-alanine-D-alanine ligase
MAKIHVICGGDSAEREVSLRSGTAVATALQAAGHHVATLDLSKATLGEITACDVVFPVLHGSGGEDGTLQARLEEEDVKYVGSDPVASRLCFDKRQYHQAVTIRGLPTAPGVLVQAENYLRHPLAAAPYVLKCPTGGSSIDTYIVRDITKAPHDAIAETFNRYPAMLMERLIVGTELTVAVLGNQSLPVIEIIPPENGEFDYENKYNGSTRELVPPEHVSEALQQRAQDLALQAHQTTKCRDFSRTDIMLDRNGSLYLLETNTIPGMTDQSLFPKAARAAGIEMPELCTQLAEMALHRSAV